MSDASPHHADLPEAIEDEVLAILDGDEDARPTALRDLLERHAQHARTIRAWLGRSGVPVPPVVTTGGSVVEAVDLDVLPAELGRYVLTRRLGRGGFGTVYRAEQKEPFVRTVAIKVLNPGMDSREVLGRFSAEREALNRMDHPGIARLLDAGSTSLGRPYFVMELVEGPPLATLCRQRKLPLAERLELFLLVLDAMEHAHQKAVLHRDLSSNNVLVAELGGHLQPKIIDFGIAKSLADPLLQGGAMTFQGTLLGTPEFMSPEQAAGITSEIDTRADVYALGVQLYELLTDQLPIPSHLLRAQGVAGIAKLIRDHVPQPPSVAAVSRDRAELRGDLDAITLRAMAKEPGERYDTVGEFADDIRAYLDDEPIRAVKPSNWYRFAKFVRRHRVESLAAAVLVVGVLVALVALWWALDMKEAQTAELEAKNEMIKERADAGFRLLANEERLNAAIQAAAALPPPWPQHEAEFRSWLANHGEPLQDEIPKIDDKLHALEQEGFADLADRHLHAALLPLRADLADFSARTLARVRGKLRLLTDRVGPELRRLAPAWAATSAGVRQRYRGLPLPPQPGLVPLGVDPATDLFEFLDLSSHDPATPLPERDPETGRLVTAPGTGIVFVLLPSDGFRIGSKRGRPGLEQNDEYARDDELGGERLHIDAFLIAQSELTRAQWIRLAGGEPPAIDAARLPAAGIDWHTARRVLGEFDLDLPTEAQWEYACRGGSLTPWSNGDFPAARVPGDPQPTPPASLRDCAWIGADAPHEVAMLRPNAFGLYDCHGNVAEWCRDEKLPYDACEARDGDGLRQRDGGDGRAPRAVRGGSCFGNPLATRSSARDSRPPDTREPGIGIRPIRRIVD
ncbi:MAG: protein kinase [Planctomycetes bacterium]|nr:protein kinase [Planctomycetota bacterium]